MSDAGRATRDRRIDVPGDRATRTVAVRVPLSAVLLEGEADTTTRLTIDGADPFTVPWGPERNRDQTDAVIEDLMAGLEFRVRDVRVRLRKPVNGFRRAANVIDVTVGDGDVPTHRLRERGLWMLGTVRWERAGGTELGRIDGRRGPTIAAAAQPLEVILAGAFWAAHLDFRAAAPTLGIH